MNLLIILVIAILLFVAIMMFASERIRNVAMSVFLVFAAAAIILPLIFMFTAAFMPAADITTIPYRWIPRKIEWHNFYRALAGNDNRFTFLRNVLNSLIVSTSVTVTTLLLSSLTGYSLAKFRFRGRNVVFMFIMMTMMIR